MMKRSVLIIFVIVLSFTAWYFTDKKNNVVSTKDFIISDTSNIDKIAIGQNNKIIILEKKRNVWVANDTFQVNLSYIARFFRVFKNLDLVAPVSKKAEDTIINQIKSTGTRIQVYANNRLKQNYWIGGLNDSKSGNFIHLTPANTGIVTAPGIILDLNSVISTNILFWRNKKVFPNNSGDIIKISVHNLKEIKKSFTIKIKANDFELFNYNKDVLENIDGKALSRYVSYFQNIGFEQLENSLTPSQIDTIKTENRVYEIIVEDNTNIQYKLDFYLKPKLLEKGNTNSEFDLNQIYGILNNEQSLLIFNYVTVDPILKNINYFIKENIKK